MISVSKVNVLIKTIICRLVQIALQDALKCIKKNPGHTMGKLNNCREINALPPTMTLVAL